jgi:hypothetical protein
MAWSPSRFVTTMCMPWTKEPWSISELSGRGPVASKSESLRMVYSLLTEAVASRAPR